MKQQNISCIETEEFAAEIMGLADQDLETGEIEGELMDTYGCDLDQFHQLISLLYDKMQIAVSPLTEKIHIGFANDEHTWSSVKKEATGNFINTVLNWNNASNLTPGKGYEREIINNGKVEFVLTLKKPK